MKIPVRRNVRYRTAPRAPHPSLDHRRRGRYQCPRLPHFLLLLYPLPLLLPIPGASGAGVPSHQLPSSFTPRIFASIGSTRSARSWLMSLWLAVGAKLPGILAPVPAGDIECRRFTFSPILRLSGASKLEKARRTRGSSPVKSSGATSLSQLSSASHIPSCCNSTSPQPPYTPSLHPPRP